MEKRKPLPVRVNFVNETKKFEETKMMENGESVIMTNEGLMEGKTSKNPFTSK